MFNATNATIYTAMLRSKYLNRPILFTHRESILLIFYKPTNSINLKCKKVRRMFLSIMGMHLHGISMKSKVLCESLQPV